MRKPKLVESTNELRQNVLEFHNGIATLFGQTSKEASAIANGCSHAVEWVAFQKDDGTWAVAFCKYAGYIGLTFIIYDKLRKVALTGTDTKRRVQKLGGIDHNVGIQAGTKSTHPAVAEVESVCAKFGKTPKITAKVRVFVGDKRPDTFDVLVAAIRAAKLKDADLDKLFAEVRGAG